MKTLFYLASILFLLVSPCLAPPNLDIENRVDRWSDMWMNQTNWGTLGNDSPGAWNPMEDPCYPGTWAPQCELPGGSGQQYLYQSAVWVGAIIVDGGDETPRVSVGMDGWIANQIWGDEMFPSEDSPIIERSNLDTVNCFGEPIFDPRAIANHEYIATFTDTLTDSFWVDRDPVDGVHRPLGIKITRTTYSMIGPPCNHIYWIRYLVENIGNNTLRDVYFGYFVDGDVGAITEQPGWHQDDLTGFEPIHQIAYICDNDGRAYSNPSGSDFQAPHVTGTIFLRLPEGIERVSFNWWVSNGDVSLDYGPAWEAYAEHDSLGMGWTRDYGTPMGDLHKYQIMSNGEHDFDQLYVDDPNWIRDHPQMLNDSIPKPWTIPDAANAADLADGYDTRYLLSFGPLGNRVGDHTELLPGESFNLWMAYVGGLNLHDPDHPQPSNTSIDPSLFDFSDLVAHVETAREGICLNWAGAGDRHPVVSPVAFTLDPVWPNPFNATARIRFTLNRTARVNVAVYDVLGREAGRLVSGIYSAGSHELLWNAENLPSGIYFIEAQMGDANRIVQKAVLLK